MNYEKLVKKVYPDAVESDTQAGYWYVSSLGTSLSKAFATPITAWEYAYRRIYTLPNIIRTTCYIQFNNNNQLRAFMEEHEMYPYIGVAESDTYIFCINKETIPVTEPSQPFPVHHINDIQ